MSATTPQQSADVLYNCLLSLGSCSCADSPRAAGEVPEAVQFQPVLPAGVCRLGDWKPDCIYSLCPQCPEAPREDAAQQSKPRIESLITPGVVNTEDLKAISASGTCGIHKMPIPKNAAELVLLSSQQQQQQQQWQCLHQKQFQQHGKHSIGRRACSCCVECMLLSYRPCLDRCWLRETNSNHGGSLCKL